jgi:hypothetical protein
MKKFSPSLPMILLKMKNIARVLLHLHGIFTPWSSWATGLPLYAQKVIPSLRLAALSHMKSISSTRGLFFLILKYLLIGKPWAGHVSADGYGRIKSAVMSI